jgi:transcriptional regulator with XRE-family HTH domain
MICTRRVKPKRNGWPAEFTLPASGLEVGERSPQPAVWGKTPMEMQPKSRTVRPDAEAIKRLRIEKGWTVEKLADKAICSVKTLENIEKGSSVYLSTLSKIATALGVEYKTLLPGAEPPPEPPRPEPRVEVQVVMSIPFDQFDESEQLSGFIEFLKQYTKGGGNINVVGVAPGSTIITLEMSMQDMLALFAAYKEGKLAEMQCVELRLKNDPKLIHPGFKTYDPTLDAKSPLTGGTSKEVTSPKIEPPPQQSKKQKPDTEP